MSIATEWKSRPLADAAHYAAEADPLEICETVSGMTRAHEALFRRSLDLVGSHGLMSPRARAMLDSGLIDKMRQTGLPGNRVHAGAYWVDHIETIAVELTKRLFNVRFAELRPLSCAIANGLVFAALAKRGDTILAQTRLFGADPSITPNTFGDLFGQNFVELPYDGARLTVDVGRAVETIAKVKPRLVVIGSGLILFPYPVRELKEAARGVGATLFYDGAHTVGLTAGNRHQDPIAEGADVLTGSVPKVLCGPTGGIILANDPSIAAAIEGTTSRLISSYPNNHLAAMAVTLAEMLRFGKRYIADVVGNAQALARALDNEGFRVLAKDRGFTQSHLVLVEAGTKTPVEAVRLLEAAGMFATPIRLPSGSPFTGFRLGTASVTRRGLGNREMRTVAAFMRRVLIEDEKPAAVARNVAELAAGFTKVHYCFD